VVLFHIFVNDLNLQLNRRQLDCLTCFCIQLVPIWFLIKVYEENLTSHKYVDRKGRSMLTFPNDCGYFPLALLKISTSDSLLKISFIVKPETP
jgi:hypothetical protein